MKAFYRGEIKMNNFDYLKRQPTFALKNMIKALSMMGFLNSEEENQRLEAAKIELKSRRKNEI
jgi:hypothetical protein